MTVTMTVPYGQEIPLLYRLIMRHPYLAAILFVMAMLWLFLNILEAAYCFWHDPVLKSLVTDMAAFHAQANLAGRILVYIGAALLIPGNIAGCALYRLKKIAKAVPRALRKKDG